MRTAACLLALLAGLSLPASAQNFVNLDFDQTRLPVPLPDFGPFEWSQAAPGWGHSVGETAAFVGTSQHLGFSAQYYLSDTSQSPFGAASGSFAMSMRSGTFREQEPRGEFVQTFLSQTGTVPAGARELSLLSNSADFGVEFNGTRLTTLLPVGLDIDSPSFLQDLLTYSGEWRGNIGSFAGEVVELRILNFSPSDGEFSPNTLTVDEIRFLPIPEPSTAALIGLGLLALLPAARYLRGQQGAPLRGCA